MYKVILFIGGLNGLVLGCTAQDSISVNDARIIRTRSETTVERYLRNLLNSISYAGAESADIKTLINQSFTDSAKKIFLNNQVAIADDVSDPDYTNSSNSPEVPVVQYLNAFNTFYGKTDSNSVFFSDIRTSHVKKGKKNMYLNVYFKSFFRNICLAKPSTPYKTTDRVAEIFIKKGVSNKWLLYISRISFFNPSDTLNDYLDDVVVTDAIRSTNLTGLNDGSVDPEDKFSQYVEQARLEEKKRNYPAAINLYTRAIELDPGKRDVYTAKIKELNAAFRMLTELEEKYRAGYYKDAIKGYSELLKKSSLNAGYSNSDYYLGRAKCYDKMGQLTKSYNEQVRFYHSAMDDYAKSYEFDNDNLETIRSRADLYRRMNENVEALTEYRIYLAKDSTNRTVYEAVAAIQMINGNPDNSSLALNYEMGNRYLNAGKFDSARVYLSRAYQMDSANGYILYSMASCIYLLGNTEESLKWFERSFRTNAFKKIFVDQDRLLGPLQEDMRFKNLKKKYLY